MDQVGALLGVQVLVLHLDGAAGRGAVQGRLARVQVVPGVVGHVVGALRLVDAQQLDAPPRVGDGHANVATRHRVGPVRHPVRVDFASQDPNGRRVAVVRRRPDCGPGKTAPCAS